jgi:hypothetical protein
MISIGRGWTRIANLDMKMLLKKNFLLQTDSQHEDKLLLLILDYLMFDQFV